MNWVFRCLGAKPQLESLTGQPYSAGAGPCPTDHRVAAERVVAQEAPGDPAADGPFRRLAEAIAVFDVFPPRLLTALLEHHPVRVGSTVGLQFHFLPGIDLLFGARVTECFDERAGDLWRSGFSYRTLHGHPFCGEETFSVEKDLRTGVVLVALRSWSRPDGWLARLGRPFIRVVQRRAVQAALDHLEAIGRRCDTSTPAPSCG